MNEEIMKNYSIRLGSDEIKRLEVLSSKYFYWRRSGVIRGILLAIFKVLSNTQIYDLVRFGYGSSSVEVTITIKQK